ncbi:unnamed protein product, partial [Onchocerca ochengi]
HCMVKLEETFDPNNGSLIDKFDFERINSELELLARNQAAVNAIPYRPKDDSLWQEISKQGKELTDRPGKEFDQISQSIQEELESVTTYWRLIIVPMNVVTNFLVIIGLKIKLAFLRSLFCFSRERNSNYKNSIVLPTKPKLTQILNREGQGSVTKLNLIHFPIHLKTFPPHSHIKFSSFLPLGVSRIRYREAPIKC